MTMPSIQVSGNVAGSIVVGDYNFVVNTNHGTIVYQQAAPQVRIRQFSPQPPRPPRGFVNRVEELSKLEALIAANGIVLLHGPDGIGKSSLLKQAANLSAAKAMPNGVIVLEGLTLDGQALGHGDIIQRLFDALFESTPPLKVDALSARTYLSNTRPLILMDEVGISPALQKALPDLFPKGSILLSVDVPFGDEFERLAVPPLPRTEALELLAAKSGLVVNDANRPTLDKLCALLNDVSLALVVTANVMRETHTDPETALQTIGQYPIPDKNPIQAALNRAFAFAFTRLSPDERKVLSAAALTPSVSLTPEWLSAALGGSRVDEFIQRLTEMGLLVANNPRLSLPAGFRAAAQRVSVLNRDALMARLVQFLLAPLAAQPQNWEHIRDELGNFFGALAWAVQSARAADVIALTRALDPYLTLQGLWDAWGLTLGYALDAARQSGDRATEAWAMHQSGTRAIWAGTKREALHLLRQALELRRLLGDAEGMAYTRHNIDMFMGVLPAPPEPPPPPPPPPSSSPNWLLLLIGAGFVGILCLAALLFLVRFLIFPPVRQPTRTVEITPTETLTATPSPSVTASPTVTVTFTPVPSVTVTLTSPPTPTGTFAPTPLGGADEIAFQIGPSPFSLGVIRSNGVSMRTLYKDSSVAPEPAWSPDGRYLAFVSDKMPRAAVFSVVYPAQSEASSQLYIADADGSNPRLITQGPGLRSHPAWSPDGQKLVFVLGTPNQGGDIYSVNIDGSNLVNLTNSDGVGDYAYPEWSPDGSRIAYQSIQNSNWEIFTMNPDGSDPIQLTRITGREFVSSIQATWSPDSQRIVFASDRSGSWDIYMMNRDGSGVNPLTQDKFTDSMPDWSPDGRLLVFASDRTGRTQLYIMTADGVQVIQLTNIPNRGDMSEPDWRPPVH